MCHSIFRAPGARVVSVAWEWLGPTTTVVAGIAGVVGTAYVARQGRKAQVEFASAQSAGTARVAILAEKRLFYAKFLGLVNEAIEAAGEARHLTLGSLANNVFQAVAKKDASSPPSIDITDDVVKAQGRSADAITAVRHAMPELEMLGGPSAGVMAAAVVMRLARFTFGFEDFGHVVPAHQALVRLLHLDADPEGGLDASAKSNFVKPWIETATNDPILATRMGRPLREPPPKDSVDT